MFALINNELFYAGLLRQNWWDLARWASVPRACVCLQDGSHLPDQSSAGTTIIDSAIETRFLIFIKPHYLMHRISEIRWKKYRYYWQPNGPLPAGNRNQRMLGNNKIAIHRIVSTVNYVLGLCKCLEVKPNHIRHPLELDVMAMSAIHFRNESQTKWRSPIEIVRQQQKQDAMPKTCSAEYFIFWIIHFEMVFVSETTFVCVMTYILNWMWFGYLNDERTGRIKHRSFRAILGGCFVRCQHHSEMKTKYQLSENVLFIKFNFFVWVAWAPVRVYVCGRVHVSASICSATNLTIPC